MTNVRFTADNSYLLSTGGGDHAVFQWRVVKEGQDIDGLDAVKDGTHNFYFLY